MEINNFLVAFYKEQRFIFGICPCCEEVFNLLDATISTTDKRIPLAELQNIEHQLKYMLVRNHATKLS